MNQDAQKILINAIERVRKETGFAIRRLDVDWADWIDGRGVVIDVNVDARLLPSEDNE